MNEAMTQILNAATPILCLLITAGGAYLVALLSLQPLSDTFSVLHLCDDLIYDVLCFV